MKTHLSGPWITQKEIDYVKDAVSNSWYNNANSYNKKFEKSFAQYLDMKYAIALPSCTSAIHLALLSIIDKRYEKIERNKRNERNKIEIIIPDVTWIGSSAPITYIGATPIFTDIDEKTWCLSPDSFENSITEYTKAVIPVDLYGNIPDMNKICDIAREYDITVIEDAAEAIGSEYIKNNKNRKAGSLGDIGVFSFHASKTLTTGEGGMLTTDNKKIYERCLFLRDHGRDIQNSKMFWNTEVAYKYRMSDLQAALGLAQLERIDELINRKREIFKNYKEELKDLIDNGTITINHESLNVKSTYWMVTIIINPKYNIKKEQIIYAMKDKDIDCRPFFYPLSSLPAYDYINKEENFKEKNIISYKISPYGINLPSGMDMTKEKIRYVCKNLRALINDNHT